MLSERIVAGDVLRFGRKWKRVTRVECLPPSRRPRGGMTRGLVKIFFSDGCVEELAFGRNVKTLTEIEGPPLLEAAFDGGFAGAPWRDFLLSQPYEYLVRRQR